MQSSINPGEIGVVYVPYFLNYNQDLTNPVIITNPNQFMSIPLEQPKINVSTPVDEKLESKCCEMTTKRKVILCFCIFLLGIFLFTYIMSLLIKFNS